MGKIRIVLTDTNEEARSMLQEALEKSDRFVVTGSTGNGEEALRLIEETEPDMVVLDLILPNLDGMWKRGIWEPPCSSANPTIRMR